MTPRRTAARQRAQVPHSATGGSRKDALWGCHSHEKAHSACGPHQRAHSACGRWLRREPIFADLCTPLRHHGRSQRRNSVHKCPGTAPRARFRRSVYTPAYPRPLAAAQQCTQMPRNGSESPFSPICVHSCVPAPAHSVATVYTNAPKRRREAIFADLCTLLHTHGRSRDRAGPRVPRHRRPHGPRDARALGPEVHATGAVTQPPTHTSSRSLSNWIVHVACSR